VPLYFFVIKVHKRDTGNIIHGVNYITTDPNPNAGINTNARLPNGCLKILVMLEIKFALVKVHYDTGVIF
jgi:hypothetical protein